jgi:hypothetical protein
MNYYIDLDELDNVLLTTAPDWCDSKVHITRNSEADSVIVDVDYFWFQVWMDGYALCWDNEDQMWSGSVDIRAFSRDLEFASKAIWKQVKAKVDQFTEEQFA